MKPAVRDSYAPCLKRYGKLKRSNLCNRCVYHIKICRKYLGLKYWRCVY